MRSGRRPGQCRARELDRAALTGLVLCGGAGRRLGGVDKPLLHWQGQALVDQVLAALAPQVGQVLISANRHLEQYRERAEVVTDAALALDRKSGYAGPLAGIAVGLATCRTPWLLVCPGDAPRPPADLARRLFAAARDRQGAVAHDGSRRQPLHVLLRAALADAARQALTLDGSVRRWLGGLDLAEADFRDQPEAFFNVNTPAALR